MSLNSKIYNNFRIGLNDILEAIKRRRIFIVFASQEIKSKYSRSILGAFWITLSTLISISLLGIVFGFMMTDRFDSYFPHLALGIILWTFVESLTTDLTSSFYNNKSIILQSNLPLSIHIFIVALRNLYVFLHNSVIIPIIFIIFKISPNFLSCIFSLLSFLLMIIFIMSVGLIFATVANRYRDFPNIVNNLLRLLFFMTPVIWSSSLISNEKILFLLKFNPFFWFFDLIRSPLLTNVVSYSSFIFLLIITILIFVLALLFFGSYRKRIPYWL